MTDSRRASERLHGRPRPLLRLCQRGMQRMRQLLQQRACPWPRQLGAQKACLL
jgi:hypothetical protein